MIWPEASLTYGGHFDQNGALHFRTVHKTKRKHGAVAAASTRNQPYLFFLFLEIRTFKNIAVPLSSGMFRSAG